MKRREFLRAAGGSGAAVTLGAGVAAGQEGTGTATGTSNGTGTGGGTGTGTGNQTGGGGGGGGAGSGQTKEVVVGPGGSLTFEPAELEILPGTTVNFVWESDNHNIVVESQPDGASWEGTPGSETKTYDTGYTYSHTFQTEGSYAYFCQPHKQAGMEASIEVSADAGGGGGDTGPAVPNSAKTLGVATVFAMMATLTLAFFFLKYGGDSAYEE